MSVPLQGTWCLECGQMISCPAGDPWPEKCPHCGAPDPGVFPPDLDHNAYKEAINEWAKDPLGRGVPIKIDTSKLKKTEQP